MAGAGWAPVQGAAPCCALLASRGADELVASKGFVSISQLLAPFATTTVNVRDPSTGMAVSSKITLDVRDLRKDGFLLSHTVLPHVLHEALLAPSPSGVWSVDGSLKQFNDALAQWAEPVDQETFRSYLSCLFFVSTRDENPLAALSQLIQLQHSQQHSSDGISLAPSHCARPAWTTPATLKHYVVVYEGSEEQRSREIFSQMCSTYGIESCNQLRLDGVRTANGDEGLGSPDPWSSRLPAYRILEAGLERARLSLIEKAAAAAAAPTSPSTPSMGITTISSSYSISSAASASPSTVLPPSASTTYAATAAAADGAALPHAAPILDPLSPVGGPPLSPESRWMGADSRRVTTQADKDACARLIEEYARNCLVPHAERVMRTLNEAVAGRRGISRSLASGMKKWFGGGGSGSGGGSGGGGAGGEKNGTGGGGGASVSYSPEAPQMQMRRLADLAFLFGLNAFAHSQYQAVKKEFAADNAWLHHALALEMSAYSLHLAHPQLTAAQFRCDYVENALGGLLQNGARWPSLLRAGLAAARIHTHLDQHTQAAAQLVRLTTVENDNAVGVALWSAAGSFARAKMHRKAAFYRFLAAHRWSKGGQPSLQLAAAAAAFPEYVGKRWSLAEERLALELSSWSPDGRTAIDAAERLVAPRAGRADTDTEAHLAHYGRVRARHAGTAADAVAARSCPLPAVDVGATRVICGERPLPAEVLAGRRGEEAKWRDMERAAFHAIAGTSTGFRPAHIVSDADTDNARVRETPGGERFRVQLRVRNPLPIPLQLRDVHLGVADVERRGEGAGSHHHPRSRRQSQEGGGQHPDQGQEEEHEGIRVHRIESLHLQPEEARVIELWVEPAAAPAGSAAAAAAVAAFRVASLRYQLCCAPGVMARGEIALEIRGKRLNKTEKQMKSPTYATDERLRASVAARAWPLCDVRATRTPAPGGAVYCDQLITLNLEITNAGGEPVEGLALAVDAVDRVMVEEEEGGEDGGSSGTLSLPVSALDLAATPGVRAFALRRGATGARLEPGARRRVVVKLRAPSSPAASHAVSLLLLYRGPGGGATREWRTRVECRVAALLAASTRVLDPYHGLVALRLANALTADDAAMARAEVTRVRVAVAARHRGAVLLAPEDGLAAVRSAAPAAEAEGGERRVRLESGQSQEVCVRIAAPGADGGAVDASGADGGADWTLVHGEMPPDWPLPVPEEDAERVEWGRRRLVIGVAWRANIVGKDGMVSSILGESFLPDPFAAAGLHVAGLQLGFSLSTPGGVASPIPAGDDEDGEGGEAAPVYVSVVPPQPVEHDFEKRRLCEFPVTLVLRNECGRARMADVEMRMKPKVREPLSPPTPPPRQQWWLTKECTRVRVPPRDTVEMRVMVRVLQPSAYDLLGAQMAATVRMEGEERTRPLRVPPAMAVVYAAYGGEHA